MKKIAQIGLITVLATSILGGCGNNNLTRDLDNNTQPRNTTYDDRNTAFNERGGFFGNRNNTLDERDGFFGNRNTAVNDRGGFLGNRNTGVNDRGGFLGNRNTAVNDRDGFFNDRDRVDNRGIRNVGTQNNEANVEVKKAKFGYLTIDQNSFSTTIPSKKFPHSQKIEQRGPYAIYKFQQGEPKGEQRRAEQAQPEGTPEANQAPPAGNQAPPPAGNQAGEQPDTNENQNQAAESGSTEGISQTEMKVIELTNAERRKNGLSDLKADASLSNVAREKSKDMQANNYFSHQSPTYGSPFDMMRDFGIKYNTAGENIAMGQRSPEEVVQAWMNSEGHRKNILNGNFTHIGIGYVEDGNYWTQMFIGK